MTKLKKVAAGILAAAAMATSVAGLSVSAKNVSSSYGSFTWTTSSANTMNCTNTSRLVTALFTVYADNTGAWITNTSSRKIGTYGTTATASNPGYSSNGYNFVCRGAVFNSTTDASGELWTSGYKYID